LVGTLPCQLETLDFGLETRPKDRRVHWVLKAIADECRIFVFDVHIEFADIREKEVHNLAVIEKLPTWQHDLVWAFLIELAQPLIPLRDVASAADKMVQEVNEFVVTLNFLQSIELVQSGRLGGAPRRLTGQRGAGPSELSFSARPS
jgi:hypothetical protein